MQVSIKWLKDYIDFDWSPETLADKLTMAGIPVERVIRADEGLEKVVTGRIEKITPHPDSDHLQICLMNVGQKETLQIVTGAQNVAEGQVVPVALVGAHLPNGQKISKGKLRGVASMGMLCSAGEINLDTSAMTPEELEGIYILPEDTAVGIPASEALGLDDAVLEFELTANRGDCFSVFGLVREIGVLSGHEPKWPTIAAKEDDVESAAALVKIGITAPELCYRFSARVLKNVKIAPSPEWLKQRLQGAGIRAINNVVDVTNFVMVELGQPMHAYDYDTLAGHSLTARRALPGEALHTLDDSSRLAKGDELVIADSEKAAGLAGVMGGLYSEITDKTTTIVLEAAAFNGASIRRTARACGLHTEASGRFERGVDRENTLRALDRAAQLLQDMGACTVAKGVVDVYPAPKEPTAVTFTAADINSRLGTKIESAVMTDILSRLGFTVTPQGEDAYSVAVPSWRGDVTCMEDLSEEVARIYGYENIPSRLPQGEAVQGKQSPKEDFVDEVRRILVSLGMSEELSFGFTHPAMFDKLRVPEDSPLRQAIPIMNPLTDEYPLVRTTLLAGIMENVARNFARKNTDIKLFEIAPVFFPKALPVTEQPHEVMKLAGLLTGRREDSGWAQTSDNLDFYDLKGIVETLLARLTIDGYTVEAGEHFMLHQGKTAFFKKGREVIAILGEVHPAVAEAFDIHQKMYVFEMDITTLMKYRGKGFKFAPLPKYPAINRDLALIVPEAVKAGDMRQLLVKKGGKLLKEVTLFDVFTGKQIPQGKKSLAFNLTFQSAERTLKDEEADELCQGMLSAAATEYKAELRA
ncbi:MAG: phenylalanine--tRNA ligase subunit beta [Selenomonadaceae bacterium]|nr:phenylalanine--tRNA ligase subunit beta [Selenomonadaceae bacterium]